MPGTLEERVAYIEGKVEEHSYAWQDLRERITHLEQKMDHRFSEVNLRFTEINQRFTEMNQRFTQIDHRISEVNQRLGDTNLRIDRLFFFILATLASSIGALIGSLVSIFSR